MLCRNKVLIAIFYWNAWVKESMIKAEILQPPI